MTIDPFGPSPYDEQDRAVPPVDALAASPGCGNPTLLAQLRPGDVVLGLGSWGGTDGPVDRLDGGIRRAFIRGSGPGGTSRTDG